MRIEESVTVGVPRAQVWEAIADPEQYPRVLGDWMQTFEAEDVAAPPGVRARYNVRVRAGSVDVGGLVEVVEYDPPRDIAWTSVTGLDQRGRWRVRERSMNRTHVELRLSYGV